jgi:hypothetical protein
MTLRGFMLKVLEFRVQAATLGELQSNRKASQNSLASSN